MEQQQQCKIDIQHYTFKVEYEATQDTLEQRMDI